MSGERDSRPFGTGGRAPWTTPAIVGAQLRLSVLAALQYRIGFWTEGVVSVLWSAVGTLPLVVAFGHRDAIVGWGPPEIIALAGLYAVVQGVYGALIQPALLATMERIRDGTLDHLLLRPADALLLALTATFAPWRLVEAVAGLAALAYGVAHMDVAPGVLPWVLSLGFALAGLTALLALSVLVLCLGFYAQRLQNLTYLLESVLEFARWPAAVFRGPLQALFTFAIPLAVMTSFPVQALRGDVLGVAAAGGVVASVALLVAARVAWSRALRAYTSASS